MEEKIFTTLQLCDSAFPTGGFSHSMGAEAAIFKSYSKTKDDLKCFIIGSLENLGSFSLPFVNAAYRNSTNEEYLIEISHLLTVSLTNHVSKRSSLQQGETLLSTSSESFQLLELQNLCKLVDNDILHSHQPVMFGVVCSLLGLTLERTMQMFMFNGMRTILSSLVRLAKLGAVEAQKWLYDLQHHMEDIISRNSNSLPEDAALTFPALDVLQMSHDTMFSKLFIS